MFPEFESVYSWVEGYGRTKSVSYRLWKGAKAGAVGVKVDNRSPVGRRFKRAVKKMRGNHAYNS